MLISDDGQRFAFDKRELAVLTSMMAGDERETFAALWLHPSKAQAWATDGHRAVMVERDDKPPKARPDAKPVGIPAATAHHAAKTAGRRDLIVVEISGKRVAVDVREPNSREIEITSFEQIDGQTRSKHAVTCSRHKTAELGSIESFFPVHHGRGSKGAIVAINPALLAPLITLGKIAKPGGQVWMNIGKLHDPVTIVARSDEWTLWRMIVMPLRVEREEHPDHGHDPKAGTGSKPAKDSGRDAGTVIHMHA